jgi:hypothetical protein
VTALTDLSSAATVDQVEKALLDILTSIGFPVSSWHKGGIYRTIFRAFAKTVSSVTDLQALVTRSGFLDYSEGDWLVFVADQVYAVTATPPSFATGPLLIDNNAGGDFPFGPREFRCFNPTTKKIYVNRDAFHVLPNQTGVEITIDAEEIGAASSSDANEIVGIETPGNGLSCSNPAAVVGYDRESDPSLRLRCRLKLAALSPDGPRAAHEYIARTFDLNGGVVVRDVKGIWDSDIGEVTLYVAGPSGELDPTDVAKIQDAIDRLSTPTGIDVTVVSATNKSFDVTATVWFHSSLNVTTGDMQDAVAAYLTAFVAALPIGGEDTGSGRKVYRAAIEGAAQRVPNFPTITVSVGTPSGDTSLLASEVPVPGTMTITAVQVT